MKLSVQIPLYNKEEHIETTVRSVMMAVPEDTEIYIYDDGSTDGSYEIVERLSKEDSRIRLEKSPVNTRWEVLYRMLQNSNSEYIAFFDGDDIMIPGYVNRAIKLLDQNPDAVAVYGKDLQCTPNADGVWEVQGTFGHEFSNFRMAYCSMMNRGTQVVRRELVLKSDYMERNYLSDGSIGISHDYTMAVNMQEVGKILFLDEYAQLYRRHANSVTTQAGLAGQHESRKSIQKSGLKKYTHLVQDVINTGKLNKKDIPLVMYCLGLISANRTHQSPDQLNYLKIAERIQPDDFYVQICLANNYLLNNQPEKALEHYHKFLDMKLYNPHLFSLTSGVNKLFARHGISIPEGKQFKQRIIEKTKNELALLGKKIQRINSRLHTNFELKI